MYLAGVNMSCMVGGCEQEPFIAGVNMSCMVGGCEQDHVRGESKQGWSVSGIDLVRDPPEEALLREVDTIKDCQARMKNLLDNVNLQVSHLLPRLQTSHS